MSPASAVPAPVPTPAPAALSAFLRGVERRGAVFAELQSGDADAGDAALASAMRLFRADAGGLALSDWPRHFWTQLLAQPQLRRHTAVAIPIEVTDRLAELGGGPRAALLLRLAAGLDESLAARVLDVAQPSYRLALQRALPHHPDGRADPESWQRLRAQVHHRIKTLPPERLTRLAQAREAAQLVTAPLPSASAPRESAVPPRRSLLLVLWTLLAVCVLALVASFLPATRPLFLLGAAGAPPRALPEEAPEARYDVTAGLVSHRDFALLADPQAALAEDLAFTSWLAGSGQAAAPGPDPDALAGVVEPVALVDPDGPATDVTDRPGEASHAPQ